MVFDKGMTAIELLEFRKETRGNIPRALQRPQQDLHGFLPALNILATARGQNDVGGSETFVGIDFSDNVEGFHHD